MKRKNIGFYGALYLAVLDVNAVYARVVPNGFESFFEETRETIDIHIAGVDFPITAKALISYDTFQVLEDERGSLVDFFKRNKIKQNYADEITNAIISGVYVNDSVQLQKYNYDYDNRTLTIELDSDMIDFTKDAQYHSYFRDSNAMINETDLYVFASGNNSNVDWSNDTTVGLEFGHFNFDTNYTTQDKEFEVRTGLYDLDFSGQRLSLGYLELGSQYEFLNSTDFLHNGADYSGYFARFGTSDNLLKGTNESRQVIGFYTPQAGQMEVIRNGEIIRSRAVKQGQQEIEYRDLPRGVYTINIVVKRGGDILVDETRSIVNNRDNNLLVGELDYKLQAGLLENEDSYAEASVFYRLSERHSIGASVASDLNENMFRIGGKYYINDSFSLQYLGAGFDSGVKYYQGNVSFNGLGVNARNLESKGGKVGLSSTLYGEDNFSEWGVNYSATVFDGSAYIGYYRSNIDGSDTLNQSDNVSLTWSRAAFGGRLSFNSTYSVYDGRDDSLSFGISWSYEPTDFLTYTSSVFGNNNKLDYLSQNFSINGSWENHDASLTVGAKSSEGELTNELSGFGSGSNDKINYNAFGFYSSDNYSLSGTFKSTQVITKEELLTTSQNGRSFVSVNPQWSTVPKDVNEVSYSIYKDGERSYGGALESSESSLIPLPVYTDVRFELDTEYNDLEVDVRSKEQFTVPGTHYSLNSRVTPLRNQVFLLKDIDGNSVDKATCAGEGCKSVNDITDGVYSVTYRDDQSFYLLSGNRVCIFNPMHVGNRFVNSYCLEGIDELIDNVDIVYGNMKYIGSYNNTDETLLIIKRLEELGLASKYVAVAGKLYVYVRYDKEFTVAQTQVLEQLDTHLISTKFKPESLFRVTQR